MPGSPSALQLRNENNEYKLKKTRSHKDCVSTPAFLHTKGGLPLVPLLLAALLPGAGPAFGEEGKPTPPNILFVMVDDLPPDAVFSDRFPFLETPNIDRLASEGAVFDRAYVTTSLCAPSRASILTGTYAHVHGVISNAKNDPDPALIQFPQVLQSLGYRTALIGKWHMNPKTDPRPGFDYWFSFAHQGKYFGTPMNQNGTIIQPDGYITDVLTQKTIDFIESTPLNQPFCALLWHKACHAPFEPASRHADAFADAKIPEPPSWALDMADRPRWIRRELVYGPHKKAWEASEDKPVPGALSIRPWKTWPHNLEMLRTLLAVDEGLGQLLKVLEADGRLDNTLILFTADNGYMFGEQRRGDKRFAYEPSIRIPFAIRFPQATEGKRRIPELIANIDIGPTLIELAGGKVPSSMQGQSFLPVLRGETGATGRDSLFYQYFLEEYAPGIATTLALRTPEWKYIEYPVASVDPKNFNELYDLKNDPLELKNLINHPEYRERRDKLKSELEAAKLEAGMDPAMPLP